jgi:hypothetical protein
MALQRHRRGDCRQIDSRNATGNERALLEPGRSISVFQDRCQTRFYVVTEGQRNRTTILLPGETTNPNLPGPAPDMAQRSQIATAEPLTDLEPMSEAFAAELGERYCLFHGAGPDGDEVPTFGWEMDRDFDFERDDKGVPWWFSLRERARFKLGAILVSRRVLERLTFEEIAYCVDAHRRCCSHGMAWDQNCEYLAGEQLAVPSIFFLDHVCPRKYREEDGIVFALTNRRRTRTVVRFRDETAFIRHGHVRKGKGDVTRNQKEGADHDYFDRI